MTAILALPVTTRSIFSCRHCFSLYQFSPANAISSIASNFSFSLLKCRPHQTLASVSPNFSTTSKDQQLGRNVVEILEQRGLIESITSENLHSASSLKGDNPPLKVYCGFDPTAESLHLGNLIGIIVLSWFLRCGHKPVAVLGGATGRIGDPSGKSAERPELDAVTLEKNIEVRGGSKRREWERISHQVFVKMELRIILMRVLQNCQRGLPEVLEILCLFRRKSRSWIMHMMTIVSSKSSIGS